MSIGSGPLPTPQNLGQLAQAVVVVAVCALGYMAGSSMNKPQSPPAPAVAAPVLRPFTVVCPWCGRLVSADPSRPFGQTGAKIDGGPVGTLK